MQLLERLRGRSPRTGRRRLADDARAMRATLDEVGAELRIVSGDGAPLDLRPVIRDLLEGEVAAPTADVAALVARGADPDEFYDREVKPSWDDLDEAHRAARLEAFMDMCAMLEQSGSASGIPPEMAQTVRIKTLVLAWAFDETYGYLSRLERGGTLP